jgi:ligand-binding sensor domain-containing protein
VLEEKWEIVLAIRIYVRCVNAPSPDHGHMNEHQLLRQLLPLLAILLLTSCSGQVKDGGANDSTRTLQAPGDPPTDVPLHGPVAVVRDTTATHAPKSITRNVLQDRNGTYWFATWEGIISYDGKHFTNVTATEGLEPYHVFSLLEDADGILWFGTIGGGVYRYDPSTSLRTGGKAFVRLTTADGLPDNSILCMLQDAAGDIWFGTNEGASRYDGKIFTHYPIQDTTGLNVNSIAQDSAGTLWFATRYGVASDLFRYDGRSFATIERTPGTRFWNVRTVHVDGAGTLWLGGQDGLVRRDGDSTTQVSTYFTGYIFEDRAGNLWTSEDHPAAWVLNRSDGNASTPIATGRMIFGSTEDVAGNIWFGTMDGVGRFDGRTVTLFY